MNDEDLLQSNRFIDTRVLPNVVDRGRGFLSYKKRQRGDSERKVSKQIEDSRRKEEAVLILQKKKEL